MTYTHLIITRFMCDNFIKKDSSENIFSPEWKEMSFNMASRHIIPTLENQTNQNFILVFLISRYATATDIARIRSLSDKLNIKVIYLDKFNDAIRKIDTDYLITSRLDYDDHVYNKCVEDIHNIVKDEPSSMLWGLGEGVSIIDGEKDAYLMYNYPWLYNEGLPAPMTTLILKRSEVKFYFDIYKLGYHTEVSRNFDITQSYYFNNPIFDIDDIHNRKKQNEIDYIWIRHKYSASAICDNVIHTTNIKIDLSEKELKEKFGYCYD